MSQRVADVVTELEQQIASSSGSETIDPTEVDALLLKLPGDDSSRTKILDAVGIRRLGNAYVKWNVAMNQKAVAVLAERGEPLSFDEVHELVGFTINPRSLRNAMTSDVRITRTGRDTFGLTAWGVEEYAGIRAAIERSIDAAGGEAELQPMVADLVKRYGVAANSVMSYAKHRDFIIEEGLIRVRGAYDPEPVALYKPIEETPGVSLLNGIWHLAIEVDHDVLRGSGSTLRSAVANELGLEPGLTLGVDYGCAVVVITWSGTQPNIGSVRKVAEALGGKEGDRLFLPLGGPEPRSCFAVQHEELEAASGLARLQLELGLEPQGGKTGTEAVLRALSLPLGTTLDAASDLLNDRGDRRLADLITDV